MALTIQNVVDDVSFELDKLLDGTGGSGNDYALMVRWIDQTHKDLLHTGVFRHALRRTTTVSTSAGTRSYTLSPADVHRVDAVFDERHEQFLSPIEELFPPSQIADPKTKQASGPRPETAIATHRVSTPYPQYYWIATSVSAGTNTHTLHIFPPPKNSEDAGTARIFYVVQRASVTGATTNLDVGEDGRTAIVAGVVARAYDFLKMESKAQAWQQKYERLKAGETV